jgi:GAF domain-containing protein/HAMP domain-containing protein
MKIYWKILLITLPLIIIPAVMVSLIAFQISRSAITSIAKDSLNNYLSSAIGICTRQATTLQAKGETDPAKIAEVQTATAKELTAATFGQTGYSMVLDVTGSIIAHPDQQYLQQNISGTAWFSGIQAKEKGSFTFTWEGKQRLAYFQKFTEWGWYVISSETESELLGPIDKLGTYIGGLLALSLLIAFAAIMVLTRRLTAPIQALLASTERIRRGDLAVPIGVTTNDEIGTLANAFNSMTARLREVIGSLEQRVTERTQDLERRALQLQTASEIAQEAVSTHDLDTLLDRSVNLIQEHFGFYHVSIYAPDEQRQYAVLRAGAGEVGKIMVQRGYRVRIGEVGIVSHVAGSGEPRVINDVKTDFTFVKHPLLPDTACVAVLPLKVAGRVIGVLDVQSQRVNAFTQDILAILQTLADQLAVAIENARLVGELRNSLSETRSLYQHYTQDSWSRATKGKKVSGYQYDLSQITSNTRQLPADIHARLMAGHAIPIRQHAGNMGVQTDGSTGGKDTGDRSVLVAPLILYEQLIGVLGVEEEDPNHPWSSEEIALLEAIANQVSLTLDNARLVEETQLRSEQIRMLQEITAVAASHVNLDKLLDAVTRQLLTGYNLLHCGVALLEADHGGTEDSSGQIPPSEVYRNTTRKMVAYISAPDAPGANLAGYSFPLEGDELAQQVLSTHKAIAVYRSNQGDHSRIGTLYNPGQDPDTQTGGSNMPRPTILMVPLLVRGEPIGTITMEVADPDRQYDDDDLRLLEQIGLQVSAAIEVARNFERTANRAEYERLVGEMTSRIRETLDVETMVKTAVKEVQQALQLPEVIIRLGLPTTRTMAPGKVQPVSSTPQTGENA